MAEIIRLINDTLRRKNCEKGYTRSKNREASAGDDVTTLILSLFLCLLDPAGEGRAADPREEILRDRRGGVPRRGIQLRLP